MENLKSMKYIPHHGLRRIMICLASVIVLTSAEIARDTTPPLQGTMVSTDNKLVYIFEIRKEIAKPVWRITQEAMKEAMMLKADYILIHLNTYGGMVNIADSIRTKLLNCPVPVMVFIDNQAISAGALISIAADSIYMRTGGSIGAATVVDQSGAVVPDKYQSFMRSTMRATAEAHARILLLKGLIQPTSGIVIRILPKQWSIQVLLWKVCDSGKVLTLTVEEAIKVGYCEGKANSLTEVLQKAGLSDYETKQFEMRAIDRIIDFLLSPVVQSLLILLIIGGIYFELQTPGIGFPLGLLC
jgi:membrane-bound serine protease (ClpP class)